MEVDFEKGTGGEGFKDGWKETTSLEFGSKTYKRIAGGCED